MTMEERIERLERKVDEIISYLDNKFGTMEYSIALKTIYEEENQDED